MEDFELQKQLYKGKASLLYKAVCKVSGIFVALKLYRKARLSQLNWYQVRPSSTIPTSLRTHQSWRLTEHMSTFMGCPAGAAGDPDTQPVAA